MHPEILTEKATRTRNRETQTKLDQKSLVLVLHSPVAIKASLIAGSEIGNEECHWDASVAGFDCIMLFRVVQPMPMRLKISVLGRSAIVRCCRTRYTRRRLGWRVVWRDQRISRVEGGTNKGSNGSNGSSSSSSSLSSSRSPSSSG